MNDSLNVITHKMTKRVLHKAGSISHMMVIRLITTESDSSLLTVDDPKL